MNSCHSPPTLVWRRDKDPTSITLIFRYNLLTKAVGTPNDTPMNVDFASNRCVSTIARSANDGSGNGGRVGQDAPSKHFETRTKNEACSLDKCAARINAKVRDVWITAVPISDGRVSV